MDTITIESIKTTIIVVIALWGAYKVLKEIIKAFNERHDREQSWDKMTTMENDIMEKYKKDQAEKWAQYDAKIEQVNTKLEENQTDTEAKLQEIRSELCLLTYAMMGALDGLKQLGCNGKVTDARERIDKHLNQSAHDVEKTE